MKKNGFDYELIGIKDSMNNVRAAGVIVFNKIDEFDHLEADVVDDSTQVSDTINVGYYYKEGYYSTGFFTGYNPDSITVNVYLVDTNGKRYLVGRY